MAATDPIAPEPWRFSFRLPRPLWVGVAAPVLLVVAVILRIGVPIYRQQMAIHQLEKLSARFKTEHGGPDWLRRWLGNERMKLFDHVVAVSLLTMESSETDHRFLRDLTALREIEFL